MEYGDCRTSAGQHRDSRLQVDGDGKWSLSTGGRC